MNPLAFGTAATAIGGYPMPPSTWMLLARTWPVQLLAMFILVFQSGHANILVALLVAVLFLTFIYGVRSIERLLISRGDLEKIRNSKVMKFLSIDNLINTELYYNPRYFAGAVPYDAEDVFHT